MISFEQCASHCDYSFCANFFCAFFHCEAILANLFANLFALVDVVVSWCRISSIFAVKVSLPLIHTRMTRKRKPVDSVQQTGTSVSVFSHHADVKYDRAYLNSSAGYGSVKNRDDYGNYWKDDRNSSERYSWKRHKKEFPNANQRSESEDFKKNFERRYGYVSEREPEVYQTNESEQEEPEAEVGEPSIMFPTELVSYLRNCATSIEEDPDEMGDTIRRKCLEECSGMEMVLCFYESSSRLVERIFKGSREGACRWMEAFMKLKKVRQFEALYTGCACRCLETLIFALSTSSDILVLEHLVDLIVDGWNDLVMDTNASHFIRSFIRVLFGLPKFERSLAKGPSNEVELLSSEWTNKEVELKKRVRNFIANIQLKRIFEKVVNLALDYNLMKDYMDVESVSLVMQEMVEYDWLAKTGKTNQLLSISLEQVDRVLEQWKGRQSSRVWQTIVKRVNEDGRQSLYHSIVTGKLSKLALHSCANFVVHNFIISAKSDELVTDIFDELLDSVSQLCEQNRWCVVKGLVQAAARHEEHQSALLTRLRAQFGSSKKSTKFAFVPNVFTLNSAEVIQDRDGRVKFDVSQGNLHGSLLLQDLLRLKHNKTVVASMLQLSKKTILEMARNQKGSYVLQAFFKSAYISYEDKFAPAAFLKRKWWNLFDSNIASHVFDVLWDYGLFTMDEKAEIMLNLCESKTKQKSAIRRIMMKRLDAHGFYENRNKWLKAEKARMENLKKTVK